MALYESKVVHIEAVQWNGVGFALGEMPKWFLNAVKEGKIGRDGEHLAVYTLEGIMTANPTDWIIKGTEGELYPCKDSVFQKKYYKLPEE